MPEIINFPATDDREAVEIAVSVYLTASTWDTRERMLKAIRAVLDRYSISKMNLSGCVVHKAEPPGYAYITCNRQITGRGCPDCGADIYEWPGKVRIVSIKEGVASDDVSYGCQHCRTFFRKEESL